VLIGSAPPGGRTSVSRTTGTAPDAMRSAGLTRTHAEISKNPPPAMSRPAWSGTP